MSDYTLYIVLFVIIYLFYLYGKMQFRTGYAKGSFVGGIFATRDTFIFLQDIGAIDVNTLVKDLNSGKFDHVVGLRETRSQVEQMLDSLKNVKK